MSTNTRYGFKWSINEVLSLQREFELLDWNIDQIAQKHKRTPNAIMYKLDEEGFADYNVLYSNYHDLNAQMPVEKKSELWLEYNDDADDEDDEDDNDEDDNDEDYIEEDEDDDDDDDDIVEEDEQDEVATLSEKVYGLEESVSEIKDMIKQMMTSFCSGNSPKSKSHF